MQSIELQLPNIDANTIAGNIEIKKELVFGDKSLRVSDVYPYVYNYGNGKYVLRFEVSASHHTFEEIKQLENVKSDLIYKENGIEMTRYTGYHGDLVCSYRNNSYSVEISRIGEMEIKVNQLSQTVHNEIDVNTCTIEDLKQKLIQDTKINLEKFISEHPIESGCHGQIAKYNCSKEKQMQLTQLIIISSFNGVDDGLTWNEYGKESTSDWTLQQLIQLQEEISEFVSPLVAHQQLLENEINNTNTRSELLRINLNYSI